MSTHIAAGERCLKIGIIRSMHLLSLMEFVLRDGEPCSGQWAQRPVVWSEHGSHRESAFRPGPFIVELKIWREVESTP